MAKELRSSDKLYSNLLVFSGALGLWAGYTLSVEKIQLLRDATFNPSCNLSPLLSCSSVMASPQAEAFGFPNPYLGLIGFAAVIVVGMSIKAGATFRDWYWKLFWLGTLFGASFVHWLAFQSIYRVEALCLYCMLVWSVTIPIFFYTTLRLWESRQLPGGRTKIVGFLQKNHFSVVVMWYIAIAAAIFSHFWYYFETVI